MTYLLCIQKVADFTRWHRVFASHAVAHSEAGLHLLHILRDTADPGLVVVMFRIDDPETARAFTQAPEASQAAEESGVIGEPEVLILSE